ncbi:hypothetical protein GA0074695_1903 [Micromonospora viridifaciens]|uniref:Extracellular repeat, HAF family n=1 Tax=Micromonospora viridifaciens TaxID=1881 RepID=A0A1C4VXK0_MICVI|nr:hypothetical protein [Micromonospora viridifaciens]SCE88726.1 hypothetical protein GA0074695_1903 [Micromonospora viridifaciens]
MSTDAHGETMKTIVRRTLTASVAAGLLATSVAVAAPAAARTHTATVACTIRNLPYPVDAYRATADAIDPTGQFIAGSGLRVTDTGNQPLLLIWARGRLTTVESPMVDTVADVNADGVVIGNGWANSRGLPWRYRGGKVEPLPLPPAGGAYVKAINKAGDIVGFGQDPQTGDSVALLWPAARPGTVEVLDAPANAEADGINDDGAIVGTSGPFGEWSTWLRRPDGTIKPLTVPGAGSTVALAAAGEWAVGHADLGGANNAWIRWNLRSGSYTQLSAELLWLADVNARGVAVGGDRATVGDTSRVLPGGGERTSVGAQAIADNGIIVGFRNSYGKVTPVRWAGC